MIVLGTVRIRLFAVIVSSFKQYIYCVLNHSCLIIGFLVLLEFVILCLPYLWAFTYTISEPPKQIHDSTIPVSTNFFSFFCKVLNVFDVCGVLTYTDDMTAPLTGKGNDA